jgi:peptide/nickel transport system permease protein
MTTASVRTQGLQRPPGRVIRAYLLRWVVGPIGVLLVASIAIFFTLMLSPGDPVAQILGARSTEEQREALRTHLGLDQPVVVQYLLWIGHALQGDFGTSYNFKQGVEVIIGPRLGVTLTLVAMAMVLILILGIGLGIVGGVVRRARPFLSGLVGLMISIPSFVAASTLIGIFAVALRWFPTFGAGDFGVDRIWHLTLPAVALSIGWIAYLAQITSSAVTEEQGKEHVVTAIGRGLPFRQVLGKHILRNAGIPVITTSGLALAALLAGSVVVESAFAVDGIGSLLVSSVRSKDQPVVLAISLIIVAVFVAMTTVVDAAHVALDPKLRAGGSRR